MSTLPEPSVRSTEVRSTLRNIFPCTERVDNVRTRRSWLQPVNLLLEGTRLLMLVSHVLVSAPTSQSSAVGHERKWHVVHLCGHN